MDNSLEQKLSGNWKIFKGKIRETWGDLTDDDLDQSQGQVEQLIGRIEKRTGESRAEIRRKLDSMQAA